MVDNKKKPNKQPFKGALAKKGVEGFAPRRKGQSSFNDRWKNDDYASPRKRKFESGNEDSLDKRSGFRSEGRSYSDRPDRGGFRGSNGERSQRGDRNGYSSDRGGSGRPRPFRDDGQRSDFKRRDDSSRGSYSNSRSNTGRNESRDRYDGRGQPRANRDEGYAKNRENDTRAGLLGDIVIGRRSVQELIVKGTRNVKEVYVTKDSLDFIERFELKCNVSIVSPYDLERIAKSTSHQDVVAITEEIMPKDLSGLAIKGQMGEDGYAVTEKSFLIVVDHLTDPHNLGSLIRSAACFGADGLVLPKHRNVRITPAVTKVAAGGVEYLNFALVGGIPQALLALKKLDFEIIALDADAEESLFDIGPIDKSIALVVGSEDEGVKPLTLERCTRIVKIPQVSGPSSLNASIAGAIGMSEISRKRVLSN